MKYSPPKTQNETVNSIIKLMVDCNIFTDLAIENLVKYIIGLEKEKS